MAQVYHSLCQEIDDITCALLHQQQIFIDYKLSLEKHMAEGYTNIAKSRYHMGSRNVSSLQLPTAQSKKFVASTTVCRADYQKHKVFKVMTKFPRPRTDEEKIMEDLGITETLEAMKPLTCQSGNELESTNSEMTPCSSGVNPLMWFCVLTPVSLRLAQEHFVHALTRVGQLATLQSKLTAMMDKLEHLLNVKEIVIVACKRINMSLELPHKLSSLSLSPGTSVSEVKSSETVITVKGSSLGPSEGFHIEFLQYSAGESLLSIPVVDYNIEGGLEPEKKIETNEY